MIRISAFADEISPMLDGQIAYLQQAGIRWMEIRFVDGRNVTTLTEEEAIGVKERLDKAGIVVKDGFIQVGGGVGGGALPVRRFPEIQPREACLRSGKGQNSKGGGINSAVFHSNRPPEAVFYIIPA